MARPEVGAGRPRPGPVSGPAATHPQRLHGERLVLRHTGDDRLGGSPIGPRGLGPAVFGGTGPWVNLAGVLAKQDRCST